MSEEQVVPAKKPLPMPIRMIIAAGIILLLFIILGWSFSRSAAKREETAFKSAVSALSAALTQDVLLADRNKGDSRLLQNIADASGYSSISLVDNRGRIYSSTDLTQLNKEVERFERVDTEVKITHEGDKMTGTRGVYLGSNNRIGAIIVTWQP